MMVDYILLRAEQMAMEVATYLIARSQPPDALCALRRSAEQGAPLSATPAHLNTCATQRGARTFRRFLGSLASSSC
ncbi:hypothetical protein C2E23DRAFT_603304 [Lenzites betulinus]|nr:hypothetical protein C2E23DRAFT_603304 [Lenzites betulinus]